MWLNIAISNIKISDIVVFLMTIKTISNLRIIQDIRVLFWINIKIRRLVSIVIIYILALCVIILFIIWIILEIIIFLVWIINMSLRTFLWLIKIDCFLSNT